MVGQKMLHLCRNPYLIVAFIYSAVTVPAVWWYEKGKIDEKPRWTLVLLWSVDRILLSDKTQTHTANLFSLMHSWKRALYSEYYNLKSFRGQGKWVRERCFGSEACRLSRNDAVTAMNLSVPFHYPPWAPCLCKKKQPSASANLLWYRIKSLGG